MSLERLLGEKKLVEHRTTRRQIKDIFELVERDIKDSEIFALSVDRKFISLYSAGQLLATIVLYINGYRTRGEATIIPLLKPPKSSFQKRLIL